MGKEIERNDVDINKLFVWKRKVEIITNTSTEPVIVYMRLVGDAEINRARVFAIRKSSELRKKLRDTESDEYYAFIDNISFFDKDQLVAYITLENTKELYLDIYKEIELPTPKELKSDATLEQQEIYQKEVDEYPQKVKEVITAKLNKEVDKMREKLEKSSLEELHKMYTKKVIDSACEVEMYSAFKGMCIYFGTFTDEELTTRFFNSFDELDNLPPNIKTQFIKYYDNLEIGMEDLKKLQGLTL